jgi:hypothetical protein
MNRTKQLLYGLGMVFLSTTLATASAFGAGAPRPPKSPDRNGLDPGYAKAFGWGAVVATGKGFPGYTKCNPALFDYRKGVCYVQAGRGKKMDVRALFRDGNTYYHHLQELKRKASPTDLKNWTEDCLTFIFWASKATVYKPGGGSEEVAISDENWPKKKFDVPTTRWLAKKEFGLGKNDDPSNKECQFSSWAVKFYRDMSTDVKKWVWAAKPGEKLYVAVYVGFRKKVPEQRYFNKTQKRWVTPTTTVRDDTKPVATGTIVMK